MRRIRFVALGIVSFVVSIFGALLAPGTFLNRALSAALCTVFSFNSAVCTASLVQSSERVVAAIPPALERSIADISGYLQAQRDPSEFGDVQPSAPSPGSNPQAPPFPQDPGPNFPVRPEFDNPGSRQPTQSYSRNYPFTGMWLYAMYDSPSSRDAFYANFVQVNRDGKEYITSLCEGQCNIGNLRLSPGRHLPKEQSLVTNYEQLNIEIVQSTDRQVIWGKVLDRELGKNLYFLMIQMIPLVSLLHNNKFSNYYFPLKLNLKHKNLTSKEPAILSDLRIPKYRIPQWSFSPISPESKQFSASFEDQVISGLTDIFENEQRSKPTSGLSSAGGASTGDFSGGGRGSQGQGGQSRQPNQEEALGPMGWNLARSKETLEQAPELFNQVKNWLAGIFGTALSTFLNNAMKTEADPSTYTNADESSMANNNNQDLFSPVSPEPNPEPSPEQKPIPQPSTKPYPDSTSNNNGNTTSNNNNQQLPAPKPECSRTAKICLYSAEIYSPIEGRRLGRIGGFRAACNATNNEVLTIIQREMATYQRSALDGTLQVDQCVQENRPVVTSFTCNGGNSCTAQWGSSPTLTFKYEDKDDNASSWQISGFTRGNPIAKGTISPPNGSGTINYNPKCDPNGYGSRDFPMSVTVTDASNLTSAPLSLTLTCRS